MNYKITETAKHHLEGEQWQLLSQVLLSYYHILVSCKFDDKNDFLFWLLPLFFECHQVMVEAVCSANYIIIHSFYENIVFHSRMRTRTIYDYACIGSIRFVHL